MDGDRHLGSLFRRSHCVSAYFFCAAAVFLCGHAFATQDPVKEQEEPPIRLKKKVKPEQPATPEKKADPAPKKVEPAKKSNAGKTDPGKKNDDDKDQPDATELEEKIKELLSRVGKNMRDAEQRLAKNDLGDATQQLERDIVKDLEDLMEQQQRQQQQQQSQQQNQQQGQPQGGGSPSAQQRLQKRLQARANRQRQRRQSARRQNADNPQPQEQQQSGGARGGNSAQGDMSKIADLYKDIWGHLPETLRQEMNQYSREQFMAKYNDLLKQYYSRIAEKGRQKKDGN
jgi:hypothetical protein